MPFVQRIIEPVFLSRPTQQTTTASAAPTTTDESTSTRANQHHQPQPKSQQFDDFTTIANCTLANVLRQLASVVLVADEILGNLGDELQSIRIRSERIRKRIIKVEKTIENIEETSICKCIYGLMNMKRAMRPQSDSLIHGPCATFGISCFSLSLSFLLQASHILSHTERTFVTLTKRNVIFQFGHAIHVCYFSFLEYMGFNRGFYFRTHRQTGQKEFRRQQ